MPKVIFAFLFSLQLVLYCGRSLSADAPGAPGVLGTWQSPKKQAYGSSQERPVWFTLAEGVVGEVAYPSVELVQTRDTFLMIETEKGLLDERSLNHKVKRIPGGLAYQTEARGSGVNIKKEISVDSATDSLRIDYVLEFDSLHDRKVYLLHNPIAAGTAGGDGIEVVSMNNNKSLLAYQSDIRGDEPPALYVSVKQLVSWSLDSLGANVGFEGVNSPENQIKTGRQGEVYERARGGNVAGSLTSQVSGEMVRLRVLIQFTRGEGLEVLADRQKNLMQKSSGQYLKEHLEGWRKYLNKIGFRKLSGSRGEREEASLLVLKALEDKREVGAFIAAPANPQIPDSYYAREQDYENSRRRQGDSNLGYRRVWPRDLYHKAMALISVNDFESAVNIARWYKKTQLAAGWWSQNMNVDGKPSWQGYQQDQAALPVVLIAHLVERKKINYVEFRAMVRKALSFIINRGPSTDQERWEENGGLSLNSLATVIQALKGASVLENQFGDAELASQYEKTSEEWSAKIKEWALISNGHFGQRYFARMELGGKGHWDPNHHDYLEIKNKAKGQNSWFREDEILDLGFVQWIISGMVDPRDQDFSHTLSVCDQRLRKSEGYIRYTEDAYGENHKGGAWPLLSGERALVAIEQRASYQEHLNTIEKSFSAAGMLAEQDTHSVSPLGWSHANYLILLRSIKEQRSFYKYRTAGKRK